MKRFFAIIIVVLLVPAAFAAFPSPVGYVNDFAGVLTDTATMEQELAAYEKNTTIEIVVVTLPGLPEDQTLASYAVELFQEWGIGKKGEDNGILVLIVPNGTIGNRLRIELGYGIQGYITGAESGRILDRALPFYEAGDYQKTSEIIVEGLKGQLMNYTPGKQPGNNYNDSIYAVFQFFPLIIFAFLIIIPFAFGTKCPQCKSRKVQCEYDPNNNCYICTCKKCGKTFKKKRSNFMFVPLGFGSIGGSGGFGGFGGGGSGGGGAGR